MENTGMIRKILGADTDKKSVHAGAILDILNKAESNDEKKKLLSIAFVERDLVRKSTIELENKDVLDERWDELNNTHLDMILGHLKMSFLKTNTAEEFAGEFLRILDFMQEREEKVFALATALFSQYIPYISLPGIPKRIPERKAERLLETNDKLVKLINYIIGLPFNLIEQNSLVLQVIDSQEKNNDLRIALLSVYISQIIRKIKE